MKRIAMPKTWPISRKGKPRLIIEPRGSTKYSLPVMVIMRDVLKIVKTRNEAEKVLHEGSILVNNKIVHDAAYPVSIFDVVSIPKIKKYYVLLLRREKLALKEISEKDSFIKIFKVIGKKILNKKKMQFNLFGGKNLISNLDAMVNDSVVWDLKEDKIVKHLPLRENAKIFITAGKNSGLEGAVIKKDAGVLTIKIQEKILKIPGRSVWVVG